jgi:predicted acyltransferase
LVELGPRIVSIDALRGLIMFTMIFVNDLAGVSDKIVPPWLKHYEGKSGMTFVDLVFPAFLFIVGMSIPFALGSRLNKGGSLWETVGHVLIRSFSLLSIGILMVHGTPSTDKMGWSGTVWSALMYLSAILAFSAISTPPRVKPSEGKMQWMRILSRGLRITGLVGLACLAVTYRDDNGQRILTFSPFSIHTGWYGILGLIGWAYLVGSIVFVLFGCRRTALFGCMVLLLCLYPGATTGVFQDFWLTRYVGVGDTLGALPSITVAGLFLATILITSDTATTQARVRFVLLFIAGCAAGALLLNGLYGINKNNATPSWCLWACAITSALWLLFYWISDVRRPGLVARTCSVAGQNVLLAYLLSEMLPSIGNLLHVIRWYGSLAEPNLVCAIFRSAGCAIVVLAVASGLNHIGFRLRL